jgi:predicted acylesterase/phospholipase RssA
MAARDLWQGCGSDGSDDGSIGTNGHDDAPQESVHTRLSYLPGVRRPRWHDYTAFILSGGGARGALQAGALRALLEQGIQPDVVIGTSIGAWNGARLAYAPTLEGVERLIETWREVHTAWILLGRRRRVFSLQALNSMLMWEAVRRMMGSMPSLYGDLGLRQLLTRFFGEATFEQTAIPLGVMATDLTHGVRSVFYSGPVVPALLASSAIPGIFPPVRIADALYCDGAGLDYDSFEAALAFGARRIFILAIGHDTDSDGGPLWADPMMPGNAWARRWRAAHPMTAVIERSAQVVGRYQLEQALQQLPIGVERHVISLSSGNGAGILDFGNIGEWIEQGYAEAREYILQALPQPRPSREQVDEAVEVATVWGQAIPTSAA